MPKFSLIILVIFVLGVALSCTPNDENSSPSKPFLVWQKQFGTEGVFETGFAMASSPDAVYITGVIAGDYQPNTRHNLSAAETNEILHLSQKLGLTPDAARIHYGRSDIFAAKYNFSGKQLWYSQLGSEEVDLGWGITLDDEENVYLTGRTSGSIGTNKNLGDSDMLIAKFDRDGIQQWVHQYGTSAYETGHDIKYYNGFLFVTGTTSGNLVAGTGSIQDQENTDSFLMKLTTDGSQQWVKQFGGKGASDLDQAESLALDSQGNIYITGFTNGIFAGQTSAGNYDIFLGKFDHDGVPKWLQQLGSSGWDHGSKVIVDAHDEVYISGQVRGSFDGHPYAWAFDAVVIKFNGNGNLITSWQFGTGGDEYGDALALDKNGNLYLAGSSDGDFEGGVYNRDPQMLIIKINSSTGAREWLQQFGSANSDFITDIVYHQGYLYATGNTLGSLDDTQESAGNPTYQVNLLKLRP